MNIGFSVEKSIIIVKVEGRLTIGPHPDVDGPEVELNDFLDKLIEKGWRKIAVDLSGILFMDSAGLGSLVRFFKRCETSSPRVSLAFASPTERIREYFELTKLDSVLPIYTTLDETLKTLKE